VPRYVRLQDRKESAKGRAKAARKILKHLRYDRIFNGNRGIANLLLSVSVKENVEKKLNYNYVDALCSPVELLYLLPERRCSVRSSGAAPCAPGKRLLHMLCSPTLCRQAFYQQQYGWPIHACATIDNSYLHRVHEKTAPLDNVR